MNHEIKMDKKQFWNFLTKIGAIEEVGYPVLTKTIVECAESLPDHVKLLGYFVPKLLHSSGLFRTATFAQVSYFMLEPDNIELLSQMLKTSPEELIAWDVVQSWLSSDTWDDPRTMKDDPEVF